MKVVVANDDGIFAEGIYKLAKKLSVKHEVFVVAPDRQRSATGHGITMHHPLRANKIKFFDTDILAWSIDGTPADCIKLAIEGILKDKPDFVISGINDGPNLGTDVLYSGTVSAAMEGAIHGIQSMAISMADTQNIDYDIGAEFANIMIDNLTYNKLPKDTLLNINVPTCNKKEVKGVKITTLGARKYKNTFIKRVDPRGQDYYWLGGELIQEDQNEDSDVNSVKDNYISVTPIHYDLTDYDLNKIIRKWNIKF
ncbi:5'/3'-nucleotidase SurE [Maledivibacter halophilus]|uniref:5'-nucleotidase SurE n=1 Tax=Maledivibacter halophilus TaxID=36842 RepID=A0A1T5LBU0_9FIRM|nr:5'/3'-nucleotidase SurE [Maledivibacter halophilus]SKC72868.1 5'-nucleotidase /3'-nucleotidase /exopolyphosphatase [Maledivibacter halophilus]